MSAAIKSLTPKILLDFVHSSIVRHWDGDRNWESVDVEIRHLNYQEVGEASEPMEFHCRIYSREEFSWLYALSFKDVCDVINGYFEDSFDSFRFRCEGGRYEMMKVPGTNDFSIDLEVKIVDLEYCKGELKW